MLRDSEPVPKNSSHEFHGTHLLERNCNYRVPEDSSIHKYEDTSAQDALLRALLTSN